MRVLIRQAKIVDPRSDFHDKTVDLLIENGSVIDIATTLDVSADIFVEEDGLLASPGWTDIFADYREPGYEQKETIESGLKAAARGGFTEVFIVPNTSPAISTKSVVDFIVKKSSGHPVSLHPIGALTQNIEGKNLAEMMDMRQSGAIAFSDGWKPVQNANLMLKALEYVKAFNGVVIQMPVDETLSAGGLMHEGPVSTRMGMAGIPALAETLMIHRDLELLRYTGSRLHITGVSTAEGVAMIAKAKAEGLQVTCSVTPYHLAFTDESLTTYSSLYKVSPPLRSEQDRQALLQGLKDGTIDCIASHHRPQDWDAKEKEFEYAADGMNIQEIAYNIALEVVEKHAGIERLVEALSTKPREIFGLEQETVAKGNNISLTLFSASGSTSVTNQNMRSLSRNNPFLGKQLKGKVIGIITKSGTHIN
jgi:dihydroorotase